MASGMDAWAARQNSGVDDDASRVAEEDIIGTGEFPDEGQSAGAEHTEVPAEDAEAEARKAKMAKQMRMIYIAIGTAAALMLGMVFLKVLSARNAATAQATAQAQQAPGPDGLQGQRPAALAAPANSGLPVVPDGSAVPAPAIGGANEGAGPASDFGLAQPTPSPSQPVAPVATAPVDAAMPSVPAVPQQPAVTSPTPVAQVLAAPAVPAGSAPVSFAGAPVKKGAANDAELTSLRDEVASLRSDVSSKDESLAALHSQIDALKSQLDAMKARPAAPRRAAASRHSTLKKPEIITERAQEPKSATTAIHESVSPASGAAPAKNKVRADYRIYAVSDGRVWVKGPDHEPMQIGPSSPLPDGTRVTSLDADHAVVYTTGGEIR